MVRRNKPKELPERIAKPLGHGLRILLEQTQRAAGEVAVNTDHYRAIISLTTAAHDALRALAPDQLPEFQGHAHGLPRKPG